MPKSGQFQFHFMNHDGVWEEHQTYSSESMMAVMTRNQTRKLIVKPSLLYYYYPTLEAVILGVWKAYLRLWNLCVRIAQIKMSSTQQKRHKPKSKSQLTLASDAASAKGLGKH